MLEATVEVLAELLDEPRRRVGRRVARHAEVGAPRASLTGGARAGRAPHRDDGVAERPGTPAVVGTESHAEQYGSP
ncbi:MAG: hypothetical protein JWP95_291 [Actinotalea sp.]|nr:hypothetical protein [Actinotalea sp.]